MNGSLVANITREGQPGWVFAHPTMMDAYADRVRSPELLHFFIEGVDINVLLGQTTCGDTGLANAIVIPQALWPTVIERLHEPLRDRKLSWGQRTQCYSYLATQCVPAFQLLYLESRPGLLYRLSEPGLMLEVDSRNYFITSLHRNGILPDDIRSIFVQHLIDYCVEGWDFAVLWESRFRDMLTSEEDEELRTRLMTEVVPNPESVLQGLFDDLPSDEDPGDWTVAIEDFASALIDEFDGDETVRDAVKDMLAARENWLLDHPPYEDPPKDERRYYTPVATNATNPRSTKRVRRPCRRYIGDRALNRLKTS